MPHETAAIYGKKGSKGVLHGSIHRAKGIQGSTVGFFKTTDRLRNRRKTFSSGFAADRGAVGPLMQIQRDTLWRQPTLFAKLRSLESTKRRSPTRLIRLEVSRHLDGNNSTGRWIRRSGVKAEVCASRESFAPQAQTKLAFPPPTLARLGINPAKSTRLAAVRSVPSGGARSLAGDVRQTPTFFGLPLENVELQRVGSAPVEVLQQFSSLAGSVAGILTGRASQDTCTTPQAACAVSLQCARNLKAAAADASPSPPDAGSDGAGTASSARANRGGATQYAPSLDSEKLHAVSRAQEEASPVAAHAGPQFYAAVCSRKGYSPTSAAAAATAAAQPSDGSPLSTPLRYVCIELKPKCGLPEVPKGFPSRFAMHQEYKQQQQQQQQESPLACASRRSAFAPQKFFAGIGSAGRGLYRQLQRLQDAPQNNLRVFVDGEPTNVASKGLSFPLSRFPCSCQHGESCAELAGGGSGVDLERLLVETLAQHWKLFAGLLRLQAFAAGQHHVAQQLLSHLLTLGAQQHVTPRRKQAPSSLSRASPCRRGSRTAAVAAVAAAAPREAASLADGGAQAARKRLEGALTEGRGALTRFHGRSFAPYNDGELEGSSSKTYEEQEICRASWLVLQNYLEVKVYEESLACPQCDSRTSTSRQLSAASQPFSDGTLLKPTSDHRRGHGFRRLRRSVHRILLKRAVQRWLCRFLLGRSAMDVSILINFAIFPSCEHSSVGLHRPACSCILQQAKHASGGALLYP
ncbi:uncharacterized protein LOC113147154 [Cyclospora cayetanensis]|uniref:inositol-pentakisphosphate 2-kinase n=1 Tax=Cyclospora cayetanensis TaxID=88456 RepID=A0A6P6RX67_9EIME|nr:uncharacterized protein LOC113147154 [Cyclospora cayetanensis]